MSYNVFNGTAPAMPKPAKGTEFCKLLLSQASKDMHEPLVPMFFPILGAHISGAKFQYPDLAWKDPTGMMANLVAHSGDNKGQLTTLAKAICRDFRQHDEAEEKKLLEWQKQTKGANKDKSERPDGCCPISSIISCPPPRLQGLQRLLCLDSGSESGVGEQEGGRRR